MLVQIQSAFLPQPQEMSAQLGEYFIIWKPKDIIGGDMYKFKTVAEGCVLAVMDCTGHGVPGALMTMIAGACFDLALEGVGYREPSKLLQRLNELVKAALNQHDKVSASNDGLDIGVCFVNKAEGFVVFSGAGIGLHYIAEGILQEAIPDRQSIGYKSSRCGLSLHRPYDPDHFVDSFLHPVRRRTPPDRRPFRSPLGQEAVQTHTAGTLPQTICRARAFL